MIKKYTNKCNDEISMSRVRESEVGVFFKSGLNARKISGGDSFMKIIYADTPVHDFLKAHYEAIEKFKNYWEETIKND